MVTEPNKDTAYPEREGLREQHPELQTDMFTGTQDRGLDLMADRELKASPVPEAKASGSRLCRCCFKA